MEQNKDMELFLKKQEQLMEFMQKQNTEANKDKVRVHIRNNMPYNVSFATRNNPYGYLIEGGKENSDLTLIEVEELVFAENPFFVGIDGKGSHACLSIIDLDVYRMVFDEPEATELPFVCTKEEFDKLLAIKDKNKFEKHLHELIRTHGEARALINYAFCVRDENDLIGFQKKMIEEKAGVRKYSNYNGTNFA